MNLKMRKSLEIKERILRFMGGIAGSAPGWVLNQSKVLSLAKETGSVLGHWRSNRQRSEEFWYAFTGH
jgi:hypothetical protein